MGKQKKHNWRISETKTRRKATRKWRREYKVNLNKGAVSSEKTPQPFPYKHQPVVSVEELIKSGSYTVGELPIPETIPKLPPKKPNLKKRAKKAKKAKEPRIMFPHSKLRWKNH